MPLNGCYTLLHNFIAFQLSPFFFNGIRVDHGICLGTKRFHDTQLQAIHHAFVLEAYFRIPLLRNNHLTMLFVRLHVDGFGLTHTLLVPHIKASVERGIQTIILHVHMVHYKVTQMLVTSDDAFILCVDTHAVSNMDLIFRTCIHTQHTVSQLIGQAGKDTPYWFVDTQFGLLFSIQSLCNNRRNTLGTVLDFTLIELLWCKGWIFHSRGNTEQSVKTTTTTSELFLHSQVFV